MALSKASLKSRIIANLIAAGIQNKYENIQDNHQLTGFSWSEYTNLFIQCVADGIIDEITSNARCNGLDSRGDSHDNVGIV